MTLPKPTVTREITPIPTRENTAHKGDVGRLVVIGGSGDETMMAGAPALVANAAFRSGAGLVRVLTPACVRSSVAVLTPCATIATLPTDGGALLEAIVAFDADVVALGPGLGASISSDALKRVLTGFSGPIVLDADGLNLLASMKPFSIPDPHRIVITPHPGEARRLLASRGIEWEVATEQSHRHRAACELVLALGGTVVLKGFGTIVTDGDRLYINQPGNSGMATAGVGDVLTGVIAALMGQGMPPIEAAILGTYLHGLAGDFAAEELGRWSMTALDVIEFLPEAFCDHDASSTG